MKHPEFYKKDGQGNIILPNPDWSDVAGLDYRSAQLRAYMGDMLKYWLKEFDLDGFRCDVAEEVPTDFWEIARAELTKIKPDIMVIAEANKPELLTKAFDLDYAWPFHTTMTNVLENGAPAQAISSIGKRSMSGFRRARARCDSPTTTTKSAPLPASASVVPGLPPPWFLPWMARPLYNGMEVGDITESGTPALFEKLPICWEIAE